MEGSSSSRTRRPPPRTASPSRLVQQLAPDSCAADESSWERRKAAQRAAREAQAQRKDTVFRAAMERKAAADAAAREAAFDAVLAEVLAGLTPGSGTPPVLSEVAEVLAYAEAAHSARREALHRQWHDQVFDPLQVRLQSAVHNTSVADIERSLQAASHAYIRATNSRLLFRDVVGGDYDPLSPLARSVCVPTGDLVDPLLHDLLKLEGEKALLSSGVAAGSSSSCHGGGSRVTLRSAGQLQARALSSHGLAKSVTRPMLDTKRWAAGAIHATPYGHCIDDRTAEYIVRPAAPGSRAQKTSHVFFDDFSSR